MNFLMSVLFILVGFTLLTKGADLFVDNASGIAKKFHISPLVIGLTIVAFGTSMPELAVSVTAALQGANEIAVGNVVGSNIFNLLVVAGMSACLFPLATNKTLMKRDWPLSTAAAALLIVFLIDQQISRLEAIVLLTIFAITLFVQLKNGKVEEKDRTIEERSLLKLTVFLLIGIAGIIAGGQLSVNGATSLARIMGWSETLIGLTIVAIGTSLPELVTSVVAARKGENEIAMGNVIGSNLFNILCILGVSAFLNPIHVQPTAFIDAFFLTIISIVFWIFARRVVMDKKIGSMMLITYVAYMIYLIMR